MATKEELDEYTLEGYEISPFINFTDIDLDEVDSFETIEVYYDKLKDFASSLDIALDDFLTPFSSKNNHVLRLYRLEEPYNIKVEDIISVLNSSLNNEHTYISLSDWVDFMEAEFEESNIFFPSQKEEASKYINDYNFHDEAHIVSAIISTIKNHDNIDSDKEEIKNLILVINELYNSRNEKLENKKISLETKSYLARYILLVYRYIEVKLTKGTIKFVQDAISNLASGGDFEAIKTLGLAHYNGSIFFERNTEKSEKYLLEAFKISHNSDGEIALKLANIYYYGFNGKRELKKAFRYASISQTLSGYFEATSLLADCYYNGLGTFKSKEASFHLLNNVIPEIYPLFLENDITYFGPIAYKYARHIYYGEGTVSDDKYALTFFLMAKLSITGRFNLNQMSFGEYLIIDDNEDYIESIIPYYNITRSVIDGRGYVIKLEELACIPHNHQNDIEFVNKTLIDFKLSNFNKEQMVGVCIPSIGFVEKTYQAHFEVEIEELSDEEYTMVNSAKGSFSFRNGKIVFKPESDGVINEVIISPIEVIYYPSFYYNRDDIMKKYPVYIVDHNDYHTHVIDIDGIGNDDLKTININGEECEIIEKRTYYFDQLLIASPWTIYLTKDNLK